jgi:hypothetical protein
MERDELIALVRRIIEADAETEEEDDRLVAQFQERPPSRCV